MVALDSDHSEPHVSEEMRLYGPLVTPGCYMVVEDSNLNGHPVQAQWGPGPTEAIQKFLSENGGWLVDESRERSLLTFNPGGSLLRI